jgi:hypothetical protein
MANSWQIGTMYIQPNGPNGLFRQPGGPGTQVFPAPASGVDYFSTEPFNERSGLMFPGCGHSLDYPMLQQEYDEDTDSPVMLIICAECSFIQYSTSIESALSTVYTPTVVI